MILCKKETINKEEKVWIDGANEKKREGNEMTEKIEGKSGKDRRRQEGKRRKRGRRRKRGKSRRESAETIDGRRGQRKNDGTGKR